MPFVYFPHRLEYEWLGPPPASAPTIVLLHHGLGSVSTWRDFPERVAAATGLGVMLFSRQGYGQSEPVAPAAREVEFMHQEALGDLPRLLRALDVARPILVGHSDGGSIALIYAASGGEPAPLALVLLAPHVFVEECTLEGARAARAAYVEGDLRERLARHHADPDSAFWGWNATWLQPDFRDWNIEAEVSQVRCPITVVQGLDDEYGTVEQLARIRDRAAIPPGEVVLRRCGHLPARDRPTATLAAIRAQVRRVLPPG